MAVIVIRMGGNDYWTSERACYVDFFFDTSFLYSSFCAVYYSSTRVMPHLRILLLESSALLLPNW